MSWHQDTVAELIQQGYQVRDFAKSLVGRFFNGSVGCVQDFEDGEPPDNPRNLHNRNEFVRCRRCRQYWLDALAYQPVVPDAYRWVGRDLEIVEVVDTHDVSRRKLTVYSDMADAGTLPGALKLVIIRRTRAGLIEQRTFADEELESLWPWLNLGERADE